MTIPLDGNSAAGLLREVFGAEMTAAIGRCDSCGSTAELAQAIVFDAAPGVVLRCRECEAVVARVVRSPQKLWLDLRGISYLQFDLPQG